MVRALLLIDLEEEWRSPGSEAYLGDLRAVVTNARRSLEGARHRGLEVVFTRHEEPEGATSFRPGAPGVALLPEIAPGPGERVFVKHRISPFYRTGLDEHLAARRVDDLSIGGIMTNLCVRSAVADAYDRGFAITVITDACASDSAATDRFTFDDLRKTRPEVRFRTAEEFLRDLGGTAP